MILGVSFSTTQEGDTTEMNLLPEPFFTIPTDNIHFNSVCSTAEGRVFLAAADGDLYELVYRVSYLRTAIRRLLYPCCSHPLRMDGFESAAN